MLRVENIRDSRYDTDGNQYAVMDLQVSEASDLPAMNATVNGVKIQPGSIAQIIQTGDFVTLDDDGTWYPEQS